MSNSFEDKRKRGRPRTFDQSAQILTEGQEIADRIATSDNPVETCVIDWALENRVTDTDQAMAAAERLAWRRLSNYRKYTAWAKAWEEECGGNPDDLMSGDFSQE